MITSATSAAASSGPRHSPYPVWLEKCTVSTGQTSTPIRISGNVAALLPTWPYATEDWMDKIVVTGVIVAPAAPHRGWNSAVPRL